MPSTGYRQALAAAGAAVPGAVTANLLVDTGASHTMLDIDIVTRLGLPARGATPVMTPSTGTTAVMINQYDVDIILVGLHGQSTTLNNWLVSASDLSAQGIQGLLGRDVLQHARMTYSGPESLMLLSF